MNMRRQLYKKFRLDGFSAYAAARKAGYSHNTAKNATSKMEKDGDFDQFLEIAGLTDKALAEHAQKGFDAEKVVSVESDEVLDNGKVRWVEVTVPDWTSRHKYFETILKLRKKVTADDDKKPGETKIIIIRAGDQSIGNHASTESISRQISI